MGEQVVALRRREQHSQQEVWMEQIAVLVSQRGKFSVLIVGRCYRSKNAAERLPCHPRHMLPKAGKTLHARHGAETGVARKHFVPTKSGERDLHARGASFS